MSYDRLKVLEWGAEECEIWDRRKMKKSNPDTGFASNLKFKISLDIYLFTNYFAEKQILKHLLLVHMIA